MATAPLLPRLLPALSRLLCAPDNSDGDGSGPGAEASWNFFSCTNGSLLLSPPLLWLLLLLPSPFPSPSAWNRPVREPEDFRRRCACCRGSGAEAGGPEDILRGYVGRRAEAEDGEAKSSVWVRPRPRGEGVGGLLVMEGGSGVADGEERDWDF